MKKRWLSLALAGLIGVSAILAGCGNSKQAANNEGSSGRTDNRIHVAIGEDVPTFDVAKIEDNQSSFIAELLYEPLYSTGEDGKPIPGVAEKYSVNGDSTEYTFTLRDAKWSNGDPITAHDFKYAWLRGMDPATGSKAVYRYFPIKNAEKFFNGEVTADQVGVVAKDDKTLVVTLERSDSLFVDRITYPTFAPLNEKVTKGNDEWVKDPKKNVFNGPYVFSELNISKSYKFDINENYWNAKHTKNKGVDVQIIKDANTVYEMFKNKELDILGNPVQEYPAEKIEEARELKEYKRFPFLVLQWAKLNTKNKFLSNVHIRRAIAYAINRQEVIEGLLKNNGQVALMGFNPIAPENAYWKDGDVEAAKKELEIGLKELGLSSPSDIKLEYRFNTNKNIEKMIQVFQEQLTKGLGIEITLKNEEWKTYLQNLNQGNYDIGRSGWIADINDVSDFLSQYTTADNGDNQTFWENEEFKNLMYKAAAEPDSGRRAELYRQAEAILASEVPVVPIYTSTVGELVQSYVTGYAINPLGRVKWQNIEIK